MYVVLDRDNLRCLLQVLNVGPVGKADLSPSQHLSASFFVLCHGQSVSSVMTIFLINPSMVLHLIFSALNSQNSFNELLSLDW